MKTGKDQKMRIVKSYCYLPLYHHVKMNEKYELLSLYILIIENWDSINKPEKTGTEKFW